MRKIGIVTLNGYFNYGNRLQNYALQSKLEILGFNVETIIIDIQKRNKTSNTKPYSIVSRLKNKDFNKLFNKSIAKLNNRIYKAQINESNKLRTEIFKKFTLDYIKETDFTISDGNIPEDLLNKYNYFVVGSDQVWNPSYIKGSSIYFLTFAEKYKRIVYAPSFGISEIKSEFIKDYSEWISEMHRLSVREDDGAKLVKELTGRDAPVLVDPTLLLTKDQWLSISKEANNKPKGRYMLTYFLGGVPSNYKKQIKDIAKKNKLEVINLGDIREKETYRTGPSEFIDYINSCSIFCTDSFHGAVFSILMEKPFIVYERMGSSLSMFSRINTLLNKFDLNSRKAENIKTDEDVFNIDYSHVPTILEMERKKSTDYLKEALNIKDEN